MRHLFVIVDMSRAMEEADLKPSRLASSVKVRNNYCYMLYNTCRYKKIMKSNYQLFCSRKYPYTPQRQFFGLNTPLLEIPV